MHRALRRWRIRRSDFSEDKEIHIRSVKLERTENNMEEEQQESDAEMAEDDVVDDDAAEIGRAHV